MNQVHVCLLSKQLLPNLIPIFMERPSRVYLVVSPEMEELGLDDRMKLILKKRSIEVRLCPHAPGTGLAAIRDFATKLVNTLISAESGNLIVLNATGGTKLLAMGFYEIFRDRLKGSLRVIYTDTDHGVIETLVPPGEVPDQRMQGVLDVESYLEAQGMTLTSAASDEEDWKEEIESREWLTKFLAENFEPLGPFFEKILSMDQPAEADLELTKAEQVFTSEPTEVLKETLTHLANMELVGWDGAKSIYFKSSNAMNYLKGVWLEEYAWLSARDARLQDTRCAAKVHWRALDDPGARVNNELDLLTVHNNRVLIVECKTGKIDPQSVAARLESLKHNVGGQFGDGLLVSARKLTPMMKERCKNLGIATLEQDSITELQSRLEAWRDNANT